MKAIFKDTRSLQKVLRVMAGTNKLINMTATPSGLHVQAMTTAQTTLLSMTVGPTFFQFYEVEESCMLGLHAEVLETLVKTAKPKDTVGILYQKDKDVIVVRIGSPEVENTTEYQVRLINIDEESLGIPSIDFDVVVPVSSDIFRDWRTKTALANGPVRFQFEATTLRVEATSDEWGTISIAQKICPTSFRNTQAITISPSAMAAINKLSACGTELNFGAAPDTPLMVEANMDETTCLRFYIAPMIDDE